MPGIFDAVKTWPWSTSPEAAPASSFIQPAAPGRRGARRTGRVWPPAPWASCASSTPPPTWSNRAGGAAAPIWASSASITRTSWSSSPPRPTWGVAHQLQPLRGGHRRLHGGRWHGRRLYPCINPAPGGSWRRLERPGGLPTSSADPRPWRTGDPGLIFTGRHRPRQPHSRSWASSKPPTPAASSPCCPIESCNLGSINLATPWSDQGAFDWDRSGPPGRHRGGALPGRRHRP